MENAVFITDVRDVPFVENCDRLYYGNEFCERRIPSPAQVEHLCAFAKKRKLGFTFVTPYVTNTGLKKIDRVLARLNRAKLSSEVVINDFGVLALIDKKYSALIPVLGRLLTKQKRGPGLARLLRRDAQPAQLRHTQEHRTDEIIFPRKLPLAVDAYYKGSNACSVPRIHDFLLSKRIKRIELDNVEQGLWLELPREKIAASLYYPYVYITTTFFCPTAGCEHPEPSILKIRPCAQECRKYVFELRHRSMSRVVLLKGNTHFYRNAKLSVKKWQAFGVDRLVFEPRIPV